MRNALPAGRPRGAVRPLVHFEPDPDSGLTVDPVRPMSLDRWRFENIETDHGLRLDVLRTAGLMP